jgi:hypothetical protein
MWKLERSANGDVVIFALSGRIEAEQVADLRKLLEAERQPLVLDLREVKLVDRDAVQFLARCEADGAKLRNCPAYIRVWMDQGWH